MKNLRKRIFVPALVAAALLLSACELSLVSFSENSPAEKPRLFVLSVPATPAENSLPPFAFARVSLPSYLDVPQIVTRSGNEISRSGKNFWGEPFARAVARTLSLQTSAACEKIFAGRKIPHSFPPVRVAIERLDGTLDGNVEIVANYWVLTDKNERNTNVPAKVFRASVPVESTQTVSAGDAYAAYVRAINSAIEKLAEAVAKTLADISEKQPAEDVRK